MVREGFIEVMTSIRSCREYWSEEESVGRKWWGQLQDKECCLLKTIADHRTEDVGVGKNCG